MSDLKDLINQRIERLHSVPDSLLSVIDKQQEAAFEQLLSQLSKLEQTDGSIIASKENFAAINGIVLKLKKVFTGSDYVDAVASFSHEIKKQALINNKILEATAGSFTDNAIYDATVKSAQDNALLLMGTDAVTVNFIQPVTELLFTATSTGMDYGDAVKQLRANMVGDGANFRQYAGRVVKDAFTISDRQYVQLTAKDHDIEFWRWDGGHVSDTRVFCNERYGRIFHTKEIEKWGEGINTGDFERPKYLYTTKNGTKIYWEGMDYDTNSASIFSYCGGYNCEHVLVPQATEYVPRDVIERSISLGFYEEAA